MDNQERAASAREDRTVQEFKDAAKAKGITEWQIHDCSFCGYLCGYRIDGDLVFYDSGCDCVSYTNVQPRPWEDIAQQFNIQDHPETIARYSAFWGFSSPGASPTNPDPEALARKEGGANAG